MHKVVIERPRRNPGPSKQNRRANLPHELLPKFESMKRPHKNRKSFTDLLGPLRRWLHSQVGRPWNEVYSEACAVIKPDSVIRAHVKTHLLEFVQQHTFMHEGHVCVLDTWLGRIRPVTEAPSRWREFYVHPETGFLHKIIDTRSRSWGKHYREKPDPTIRWLNNRFALKQIAGIWYGCEFREVPATGPFVIYDYLLRKTIQYVEPSRYGNTKLHCTGKRQLSRAELRQYGVENLPILVDPARMH